MIFDGADDERMEFRTTQTSILSDRFHVLILARKRAKRERKENGLSLSK